MLKNIKQVMSGAAALLMVGLLAWPAAGQVVDIGNQRQLFVDHHLIERMQGVALQLHRPIRQPRAKSPLPRRHFYTILTDADEQGTLYRAYWRCVDPSFEGEMHSGSPGQLTRYAQSRDGVEWEFPNLGVYEIAGTLENNVVFSGQAPFMTNFSPFIDTRADVPASERYKAIAGYPGRGNKDHLRGEELNNRGLHGFVSADGIHWEKTAELIAYREGWRHAFDSQNVAFWSEAEQKYVAYFRTWIGDRQQVRAISRSTSPDFVSWSEPVLLDQNLPNEHFYTSQTHPYFRAPHIYIALPTRYIAGRVGDAATGDSMLGSTDILFMTSRAGSEHYDRLFKEAFIWPGRDEAQWASRANFVALNVVPTGDDEMSIYHRSGHRYTLRTDGFVSAHAGYDTGELVTKPLRIAGDSLEVNYRTSAGGSLRVELLDVRGRVIEGFSATDAPLLVGDEIERVIQWQGDLSTLSNRPVRLRLVMQECDVFSFRFR